MLSVEQLKVVEYLATGFTIPEASKELGLNSDTVRGWLRNNPEVVKELSSATDVFQKECLKGRSRAYRIMTKQITDKILEKIENGALNDMTLDELVKMLNKTVTTMREDEDTKKLSSSITAIQQNIQVNNNIQNQLQKREFVDKFSDLLLDIDPNDIQNVAEAKRKADAADAVNKK